MSRSQSISVTCPTCKQPFMTEVHHVVDVTKDPELKWKLLSGNLNVAKCPSCGMAGILGMPFAYHDPDKELLFIFMPAEAGLGSNDQQQLIGSLTQDVMMSLPPEKRKSYLLQPRTFLQLQSLFDAILEAEGITQEMIQAQTKRSQLINELVQASEDDEKLKALVEEHKDRIDYELFQTITATAGAAAESGEEEFANKLMALRSKLLELEPAGQPQGGQMPPGGEDGNEVATREELLNGLLQTEDDDEFEALTAIGRPLIDYQFYMEIAHRIETAEREGRTDEAQRLNTLRDRLLDLTREMDAQAEQALKEASELISKIYESERPAEMIDEHIDEIDNLFFYVLTANIEAITQGEGDAAQKADALRRLNEIADLAADAIETRMPPRLRLINQLLRTEERQARQDILQQEAGLVDDQLITTIDDLIGQFSKAGQQQVVGKLEEVRELARAHIGESAGPPPGQAE